MQPSTPADLSRTLGISSPYASMLLSGNRPWTLALAISLYRKTGSRVGPISDATDDEIDVLERFEGRAA